MELGILAFILVLCFFLCYVFFFAPKSDLVFTSASEEEIRDMKRLLEDNGIEVYIKGMGMQRLHETAYDLVNPSLHVVRPEDREKALELIRSFGKGTTPPGIDPH